MGAGLKKVAAQCGGLIAKDKHGTVKYDAAGAIVHLEPEPYLSMREVENCSKCGLPTRWWLTPHVPLCPACADKVNK